MNHLLDIDPLDFVVDSLAELPNDPAALDDDGLHRLAALQEGLARHSATGLQALATLAADVHADAIDLHDAITRAAELDAWRHRCQQADHQLSTYVTAAVLARGNRLDEHLEAHHHNGQEA